MRGMHEEHIHEHGHEYGGRRRGGGRGRGGRMRRGEIRSALLAVLTEAPGHGYEIMQRLEDKSGGVWRPSPGSVYPTLQMLEDEGLVRSSEADGKRVYELTEAGRTESERRTEAVGGPPWALGDRPNSSVGRLREAVMQVHAAARQVADVGDDANIDRAVEIVRNARKELYRLLAEAD